jgi:hypothetical protein
MNTYTNKEEVLNKVFDQLNAIQRDLTLTDGANNIETENEEAENKETKIMITNTYQAIEVAKLAVRGAYHTLR